MRSTRCVVPVVFTLFTACGSALGPDVEVDGLRFTGSVMPIPSPEEVVLEVSVSIRNESLRPIRRTFAGGCFVERVRLFREQRGERALVWDTAERLDLRACTSDLVEVSLAPGEVARPEPWRGVGRPGESGRAVLPGIYTAELFLQLGDDLRRVTVEDIRID